ncbi:MAG: serine acetyltransferase [Thermodesulfobacteriota bacterium]|nr:serine acetyltransferase [Thermodesulfobacteriota bacterium]
MKEKGSLTGNPCQVEIENTEKYRSQLPQVVEEIVESCKQERTISHYDTIMIPSKESVIEILEDLKDILFPGYFRQQEVNAHSLPYHIGNVVNRLFEKLAAQIARSIRHECRRLQSPCTQCWDRGQREALDFLKKIPALRKTLAGDVRAAYDGDPAAKSLDEVIFSYPCILAIMIYRVAHELHIQGVPLLPRIMTEYAHGATGIDMHPGAKIGNNFFIDHGTGVVIGETTEIGDRVKIYQGVTLGALSFPTDFQGNLIRGVKRHPTIEDDVTLYSNATILGPTVIGARSVIGGNVWITQEVPPDTVVNIEQPHLHYKGCKNLLDALKSDP